MFRHVTSTQVYCYIQICFFTLLVLIRPVFIKICTSKLCLLSRSGEMEQPSGQY